MKPVLRAFAAPALLVLLPAQGLRAQTVDFVSVSNRSPRAWSIVYVTPPGPGSTGSLVVAGNNEPDRPLDGSPFTLPKARLADLKVGRPASGQLRQQFKLVDDQKRWATVEATAEGPEDDLHLRVVAYSEGIGESDLQKAFLIDAVSITIRAPGLKN